MVGRPQCPTGRTGATLPWWQGPLSTFRAGCGWHPPVAGMGQVQPFDRGRWGCHSLAWRRSLRRRWRAADLASLCARPPVQRFGGHPGRACAGHDWSSMVSSATRAIWGCSSTRWAERSPFFRGSACCLRRSSFRPSSRAYVRKEAAGLAVRRRVRGLSQPHVTTDPWVVLERRTAGKPDAASGLIDEWTCDDHRCPCVIDPRQTSSQVPPTRFLLRIGLERPAVPWE
jgi:hypothetical protein